MNQLWPYKDMLCLRRSSDAGPAGRVRCWLVHCQEPKTGQQKVQLKYKDDPLCPSYLIYLCWYRTRQRNKNPIIFLLLLFLWSVNLDIPCAAGISNKKQFVFFYSFPPLGHGFQFIRHCIYIVLYIYQAAESLRSAKHVYRQPDFHTQIFFKSV